MDPASALDLRDFLTHSNSHMDRQEEQMAASNRAVQALVSQVSELTIQIQRLQTESVQLCLQSRMRPFISPNPVFRLQLSTRVSPSSVALSLPNVLFTSPSNHHLFPLRNRR